MANPKRRHSKQRGRLRRTFYTTKAKDLGKCPQCGKPKLSHRICPSCGYYKGAACVTIMSKEEKKKQRENKKNKK